MPLLLSNIIYALLDKNPETRPDATKLLSLPEVKEAAQRLHNQIREVDPEMAQKIFEEPKKFKWLRQKIMKDNASSRYQVSCWNDSFI